MATAGGRSSSDLNPGDPGTGGRPSAVSIGAAPIGASPKTAPPRIPAPGAIGSASAAAANKTIASAQPREWPPSPALPGLDPASVAAQLFAKAHNFDFFQAVRLLEKLFPDTMPVGFDGPPSRETVRFRSHVSLIFPPSQIWDLRPTDGNRSVPEMSVAFFGLVGPSGVMPRHYTEMLLRIQRDAKHEEKFALRDWFDLFTHRMLSLFYRAWEKYRFYISYERGEYLQHPPDPFTHALAQPFGPGLGDAAQSHSSDFVDRRTQKARRPSAGARRASPHGVPHAGRGRRLGAVALRRLVARRPRTAAGLAALLSDYFELPVEVQQFHGQWLQLDPSDQSQLGATCTNCSLGVNLVIGERVWDVEGKIRIRVGPLDYEQFVEFLPYRGAVAKSKAFFLLSHLTRLYIGPTLAFDVQLLLRADSIPESILSDPTSPGLRLGWNTWLRSGKMQGCVKDAVFEGQELFDLTGSRQD